jgi:hypothetical protein
MRRLLANSGGSIEEIQPLMNLAREAVAAGDGDIPDEKVREVGTPAVLVQLGLG